ncbi:MAG: rhodanese-like domain-containing protein [Rhodospirillales bacterium]|nr:rhodanese-like domain-containing protein [Rhodospirillales bacterium]
MREIETSALKAAMDRGEVQLIDVREPGEFAREHIPGARLVPLSSFDASQVQPEPGKRLVVHCLSGNRSAKAIEKLRAAGIAEAVNFTGGITAWKQAGFPIAENRKAPLPIMRQVQITAGSLALLGVVLGFAFHPGFFLLSGAIGAGLMLSGITGSCMMATLLMKLPYNRA